MISFNLAAKAATALLCLSAVAAPNAAIGAPAANETGASKALVEKFDSGDFRTTLKLARPLAEKGDAMAQHLLGLMYESGWGVEQDFVLAAEWYVKAASQGVVAAQNNLAGLYARGNGVTQDYERAIYWYRKAAEQGAAQAYYNLGDFYENGRGVPQDYKEAAALYREAASISLRQWYAQNAPRQ